MPSSSVSSRVANSTFELLRSSTLLKPRNTSGRRAVERREITATFSRPVSRLMRRDLSWGRVGVIAAIGVGAQLRMQQDTGIAVDHIDPNHFPRRKRR